MTAKRCKNHVKLQTSITKYAENCNTLPTDMDAKTIKEIEKKIGYTFRDKSLVQRAFTHSSVTSDATKNYESLEFLGDSILGFAVAKRLLKENPDAHEGALTHRRAEIVSQTPLENAVAQLGIDKYLIVGKGETAQHITYNTKVRSNLFEAVVGAIYLDSGSLECAEKFVFEALKSHFDGSVKHENCADFKSELNEFASRHKLDVEYRTVEQAGQPHDPTFTVDVFIDGVAAGRGKGKSKKAAEQEAAERALKHIEGGRA